MAWWVGLLVSLALSVISYLMMPKPRTNMQPQETKDWDSPTADAGRPVPVIFGTITVKGLNVIWYGDMSTQVEEVAYE